MQADLFPQPVTPTALDALIVHEPGAFSELDLDELWTACDLQQYKWQMYGNSGDKRRLERFFATAATPIRYRFGGTFVDSVAMPDAVMSVAREMTRGSKHITTTFNSCFANAYRSGNDCIDWHDDSTQPSKGIVIGDTIASVTLCEKDGVRPFQLRPKERDENGKRPITSIDLAHGDLLIMLPGTQKLYEHCIPDTKKARGRRLNLTFRHSRATR